jgi:predicted DNA-binding transcriptional regulator AlpA
LEFYMDDIETLTERDVCAARRCSRTKLWMDVRGGHFPKPIYFGPRSKRWIKKEVAAHLAELVAERDSGVA